MGDDVGGTTVGGTGVGGTGVNVAGTGELVGGTGVAVGGIAVADGTGTFVGVLATVGVDVSGMRKTFAVVAVVGVGGGRLFTGDCAAVQAVRRRTIAAMAPATLKVRVK